MPLAPTFFDAFKENPRPFLVALFLGAMGIALAVFALVLAVKRNASGAVLGVAAAACGVIAVASGFFDTLSARRHFEESSALPGLTEADRARIRAYGSAEADFSWEAGAGAGLLPLLGGVGAGALALLRRKR